MLDMALTLADCGEPLLSRIPRHSARPLGVLCSPLKASSTFVTKEQQQGSGVPARSKPHSRRRDRRRLYCYEPNTTRERKVGDPVYLEAPVKNRFLVLFLPFSCSSRVSTLLKKIVFYGGWKSVFLGRCWSQTHSLEGWAFLWGVFLRGHFF